MSKTPELPRYLHKRGVESLLVKTEAAYDAAIEDGWSVSNHFPEDALSEAMDASEAARQAIQGVTADAPKKRGRKAKADE